MNQNAGNYSSDNQKISTSTVRVRYAPSPTGHLHVGSLRTALYNWLFARHNNGKFLLRIEDTDLERSTTDYTKSILESLSWASLEPDEPTVIQSERLEIHKKVAQQLLEEGKAYKCYCTAEELKERLGEGAAQEGSYTRYDEKCRPCVSCSNGCAGKVCDKQCIAIITDRPYTIRFKIPQAQPFVTFNDLIRGPISFERDQLDDFIIVRSDGMPMYNFVVVVDDAAMNITHVLRGEDHISNTPKQILLYEACGYTLPQFAHFSLILGPDGQRLSKRHGATAVLDFKKNGFLADALCNYLVRLGWSHGDQEVFTREELIKYFNLEHMSKHGAIFDRQKLEWLNGMYIRNLASEAIFSLIEKDIDSTYSASLSNWSAPTVLKLIDLYKERIKTLKELMDEIKHVHEWPFVLNTLIKGDSEKESSLEDASRRDKPLNDSLIKEQLLKNNQSKENSVKNSSLQALEGETGALLASQISSLANEQTIEVLKTVNTTIEAQLAQNGDNSREVLDRMLKDVAKQFNVPFVNVAQPLRLALTGRSSSPGIVQLMSILSLEESRQRIGLFLQLLERGMRH